MRVSFQFLPSKVPLWHPNLAPCARLQPLAAEYQTSEPQDRRDEEPMLSALLSCASELRGRYRKLVKVKVKVNAGESRNLDHTRTWDSSCQSQSRSIERHERDIMIYPVFVAMEHRPFPGGYAWC